MLYALLKIELKKRIERILADKSKVVDTVSFNIIWPPR